jgi:hypothetical protein
LMAWSHSAALGRRSNNPAMRRLSGSSNDPADRSAL